MTLEADYSEKTATNVRQTGSELIAFKIVEFITQNGLIPGDRLPSERALGAQFQVSRTVIREAVKSLIAVGIVRAHQGLGLYVQTEPHPFTTPNSTIDIPFSVAPKDVENLFQFRLTIETQTARLAAESITFKELRFLQEQIGLNQDYAASGQKEHFNESDRAFHIGIAQATHNVFFVSAVATVHRSLTWITQIIANGSLGSLCASAEQHLAILAALQEGEPEEAAKAMHAHIGTVLKDYQREVRRYLLQNARHADEPIEPEQE